MHADSQVLRRHHIGHGGGRVYVDRRRVADRRRVTTLRDRRNVAASLKELFLDAHRCGGPIHDVARHRQVR